MIRNVVVGRLKDGVEPAAIEPGLAAIAGLEPAGLIDKRIGTNLGLREANWDFAITSDFADEASYRGYDLDVEHNRIRSEMIVPFCDEIARIQFGA